MKKDKHKELISLDEEIDAESEGRIQFIVEDFNDNETFPKEIVEIHYERDHRNGKMTKLSENKVTIPDEYFWERYVMKDFLEQLIGLSVFPLNILLDLEDKDLIRYYAFTKTLTEIRKLFFYHKYKEEN